MQGLVEGGGGSGGFGFFRALEGGGAGRPPGGLGGGLEAFGRRRRRPVVFYGQLHRLEAAVRVAAAFGCWTVRGRADWVMTWGFPPVGMLFRLSCRVPATQPVEVHCAQAVPRSGKRRLGGLPGLDPREGRRPSLGMPPNGSSISGIRHQLRARPRRMDRSRRVRTPGNRSLAAYGRIIGLDLTDVSVDTSSHKAPCGGPGTGKNPTDRAKLGIEWSLMTDRNGIPVASVINSDRRHDTILFGPTLQAAEERGLLPDVETLHLDRGYDSAAVLDQCRSYGITDVVCAKKRPRAKTKTRPGADAPRDALDRGTHQLMAVQLRAAPPQHRPLAAAPPSSTPHRDHPAHHRQTHRLAQPMEPQTLTGP